MKELPEFNEEIIRMLAIKDAQAHQMVREEREPTVGMVRNRSASMYVQQLLGLKECMSYIRGLPAKAVLDVGAGTTLAVSQLAKSSYGQGLNFLASVLYDDVQIGEHLGYDRTIFSSAEELTQIANRSIGGIIANDSLGYSQAQLLVALSFDRILVPGGVIKVNFPHDIQTYKYRSKIPSPVTTRHELESYLRQMGYGIHVSYNVNTIRDVLVAIKHGTSDQAIKLLNNDAQFMAEQVAHMKSLYKEK